MSSAKTPNQLLNPGESMAGVGELVQFEHLELSPPLILTAAMLYMMSCDGEVEDSEISRLQSVLGGHSELLACAQSYTQTVPIERFLAQAAVNLSALDKLCILINVCEAFMADGVADAAELDLFARISEAFGISPSAFGPFLKTIQIKNDKACLGPFELELAANPQGAISEHLALATCILYMAAADGTISAEEIGCLQTAIGAFEGLRSVAVKYIGKVKSAQFLKEIAPRLRPEIQLLILINACDTMLADGILAPAEKKLFTSMLSALGYTEKSFAIHYKALHIKNVRSFDLDDFANSPAARVFRSAQYQKSQVTFMASRPVSSKKGKTGLMIQRAMQKNVDDMSAPVHGLRKIEKDRAGGLQNSQALQTEQPDDNIHFIDDSKSQLDNVQFVDPSQKALADNIQFVGEGRSLADNVQFVDEGRALADNVQLVNDSKPLSQNRQFLEEEQTSRKNKPVADEGQDPLKSKQLAEEGQDPTKSKQLADADPTSSKNGRGLNSQTSSGGASFNNSTEGDQDKGETSGSAQGSVYEEGFRSGNSSEFSTDSDSGKGGLTAMAQGEMSFRERAMQMGGGSNWAGERTRQAGWADSDFGAGTGTETGAMVPAIVRVQLKGLKSRNEQVEVEVNKLFTFTNPNSVTASSEDNLDSPNAAAENSVQEIDKVSVLKRVSQVFLPGGNSITKPQSGQGASSDPNQS
jgi:uncharacterized tellurite resistance protein B-like protein